VLIGSYQHFGTAYPFHHQWSRMATWPLKMGQIGLPKMFVGGVKCTLVQALRLCTGRMTHRGSRGVALLFLDHGSRRRWGVSVTPRPLSTSGKDPVPIVQETGWAPGPVWTVVENLDPTAIRSLDRPARRQSLYRLSYPAHQNVGN